jgi:hypothetical protein
MDISEKQLHDSFKQLMLQVMESDKLFLDNEVPMSKIVAHEKWQEFLIDMGNQPGMRILEIGSREVSGKSNIRSKFDKATYVGFDFYPGTNVDVVGDAHKLTDYFNADDKFDIIFSSACFEHFAMPWVVAVEMSKLVKIGGIVFVETHFTFSSHERPWHFYHFTDMALKSLFSRALGFECIEAGMSNPIVGRFSTFADECLKHRFIKGLYCHSEYLGKKVAEVTDFDWNNVPLSEIVGETVYPKMKSEEENKT